MGTEVAARPPIHCIATFNPTTEKWEMAESGPGGGLVTSPKGGDTTNPTNTDIQVGGTQQELFAAKADRSYFFFQNISGGDLWIEIDGNPAVEDTPSIKFGPGAAQTYEGSYCPTNSISVIGAAAGQKFVAKQA